MRTPQNGKTHSKICRQQESIKVKLEKVFEEMCDRIFFRLTGELVALQSFFTQK